MYVNGNLLGLTLFHGKNLKLFGAFIFYIKSYLCSP